MTAQEKKKNFQSKIKYFVAFTLLLKFMILKFISFNCLVLANHITFKLLLETLTSLDRF